MSINKLIPLKDIIYDAFEDMGIDINTDFPTFKRWALRAESHIGSYYSLSKKTFVLKVNNCCAVLPLEARIIRAVVAGDCGCECGDLIEDLILWTIANTTYSANQVYLSIDKPDSGIFPISALKYDIIDNKIVFNQNLDGQMVTVQTMSNVVDCNGEVEVNENHTEAITEYLMYKYAKRSRFSPNKMELGDYQLLERKWEKLRDGARADDAILNPGDREKIVEMLHNPYAGWGLQVGMYNPSDNYGRR